MRKLNVEDLVQLKPKILTDQDRKEWLLLTTWCVICQKFIEHWVDDWGNPGPAFSADMEVSGYYCSHHTGQEIETAKRELTPMLQRRSKCTRMEHHV